jgi:predicted ArsR family transcriptional regulator
MLSIYEQTKQGKGTRSHILTILIQADGLTRNELFERSHLTYEQVRRQTRNLHISGAIESRLIDQERRYFVKKAKVSNSAALLLSALLVAWMPVLGASISDDDVRNLRHNQTIS